MTPRLSPDQRSLFGDLSQRLALRAIQRCRIDFGEYQGWFWHSGVTSYRKTLGLLENAGIFRVVKGAMLELSAHEIEISAQLQAYSAKIGPEQLDLCIEAFVDLFSEFPDAENPPIPITRHPFSPAAVYSSAFEKLKANGYVSETAEGWVWSDLMVPAMARIGVWSLDGVCYHDQFQET